MPFFTVWPNGGRPEDYPSIGTNTPDSAARLFASEHYFGQAKFDEIELFVQERTSDTATLYQVRAVPEIEFYAEEI